MDLTFVLAYWLYFIFAVYLGLLVLVAVRRVSRGKAATESAVVRVVDGVAEIRQGADLATLVGLFLVAASFLWTTIGVAVAAASLSMLLELPTGAASTMGVFYMALSAFAGFIIIWSIWLGFGCWGVVIDSRARTVTTWWGLMQPWRRHVRPLSDFDAVAVRLGPRRGLRARSHIVVLEGKGKAVLLDRGSWQSHDRALEMAREMGEMAGIPIKDQVA